MKRLLCLLAAPLVLVAGFYSGSATVTTSGTPVHLSAASPAPPVACVSLTITAKSGNSGTLYVGASNVSASGKIGIALAAATSFTFQPDGTLPLYAPQSIWLDTTSSGDGFSYSCIR